MTFEDEVNESIVLEFRFPYGYKVGKKNIRKQKNTLTAFGLLLNNPIFYSHSFCPIYGSLTLRS